MHLRIGLGLSPMAKVGPWLVSKLSLYGEVLAIYFSSIKIALISQFQLELESHDCSPTWPGPPALLVLPLPEGRRRPLSAVALRPLVQTGRTEAAASVGWDSCDACVCSSNIRISPGRSGSSSRLEILACSTDMDLTASWALPLADWFSETHLGPPSNNEATYSADMN